MHPHLQSWSQNFCRSVFYGLHKNCRIYVCSRLFHSIVNLPCPPILFKNKNTPLQSTLSLLWKQKECIFIFQNVLQDFHKVTSENVRLCPLSFLLIISICWRTMCEIALNESIHGAPGWEEQTTPLTVQNPPIFNPIDGSIVLLTD